MRASRIIRVLVLAAAATAFFAVSSNAFASSANMSEVTDGQQPKGHVEYAADAGETNDVTISMNAAGKLVIRDRGVPSPAAGWGWFMGYGCATSTVSDAGGIFPVVCEHPNGIASVDVWLCDGDDSLTLDPSLPSTVVTVVHPGCASGIVLNFGGGGYDTIDLRGGSTHDSVTCWFDGRGWAIGDAGDSIASNCRSEALGGVATSGPAVVSMGPGRLDVFARGTDNALWHKWFDGSWHAWESLGGQMTSDPAAVSWANGRLDVFWRGAGGDLRHKWFEGGYWSGEQSLGGQLIGGPAAASWGANRIDVFGRGLDSALWHTWWDGSWHAWQTLGGGLTSDPDAVSWGPNRLDVFARGLDDALWHLWWDGSWHSWEPLGGGLTSAPAAAVVPGTEPLRVVVRGTDRGLYSKAWDQSAGWQPWQYVGGRGEITSDPAATTWSTPLTTRTDVFFRGTDNALYRMTLP